jgi:Ca-activated chloride channel family protein
MEKIYRRIQMKPKIMICFLTMVFGTLFCLNTALSDGLLIIEDPPFSTSISPEVINTPVPLTVKYHRVNVTIDNQVAVTSIDQVFKNKYDTDLEGTYIFPLPEEAAISDFAMYINGARVSGEILDREKARQVYEDIVRRMKDPGLLEYVGRNMFRARVYPIPKHGETRIELRYEQTLEYDSGMCRYVYPLDTERFSPGLLEEVTISVKVRSSVPIKNIYSPSHRVDIIKDKFRADLSYEEKDVRPDKDFVLYYTVSEKDLGLNLLCYKNPPDDGYFLLLVSPGQLEKTAIDKDVIFILDTSGSMRGEKLEQAKQALLFCVNSLGDGDRFNIVGFATDVNPFKISLTAVNNKTMAGAADFIAGMDARGGTNINDALISSLNMFSGSERPEMIVFLTDGEPTVGVTDMKDILKNLAKSNKAKARLFVFGVGYDVNSHLLDNISREHRGVPSYVVPGENIEVKVSSFYSKISEPVLSDTGINFGKIKATETYPGTIPDIFKGSQLMLFGRYRNEGAAAITLTGYVDGRERKFVYEGRFPGKDLENDFIPRVWASRKIGFLQSEIRLNGEKRELVEEIVRLSKEFGIMTPYTSFLILEEDAAYEEWGIREEAAPLMKREGKKYKDAMKSASGSEAVSSALDIMSLEESETDDRSSTDTVKYAGEKTFYLRDGIWVDSKYKKGIKVEKIKYLSKKYFNILKDKPGLGKYFATAKNIMVVYDSRCYRVTD